MPITPITTLQVDHQWRRQGVSKIGMMAFSFHLHPSAHPSEDIKLNYLSIQYFCMPPSKRHSPLRHTAPGKKLNDPGQRLKVVTKGRQKKVT
ncbi:hypothetical protein CDAR_230721 [Caerostris darwini]|uniref:Uncharacterized protein n=1 Tax=Caerostris darwini TaxID=1538125 RepID=A0AAV4S792_9ARAC|nr:hypothetical protein CDAR_230721 [Caerostris darwini]